MDRHFLTNKRVLLYSLISCQEVALSINRPACVGIKIEGLASRTIIATLASIKGESRLTSSTITVRNTLSALSAPDVAQNAVIVLRNDDFVDSSYGVDDVLRIIHLAESKVTWLCYLNYCPFRNIYDACPAVFCCRHRETCPLDVVEPYGVVGKRPVRFQLGKVIWIAVEEDKV